MANKFKTYCIEHGIKQTEIAEVLNVSVQTVNRKLNNKQSFTLKQVKALCVHYGISADKYF
jgi:transcriptional regulator with XRE-family HTH domain